MANRDKSTTGPAMLAVLLLILAGLGLGYWTMPGQLAEEAATAPQISTAPKSALAADDEKIIAVVRSYLLKNPEILQQMSVELQRRQEVVKRNKSKGAVFAYRDAIFASKSDYVSNPGGNIPVVEFFDYQCGYCKRVHGDVTKLKNEHTDIRFIYKEFPILGPISVLASQAAIASKQQGKYVEYHSALMSHPGALSEKIIFQLANNVGLDVVQLNTDMKLPQVQAEIDTNKSLAQVLGVNGTPTLIFGDELVPGAIIYRQMALLIEKARRDCKVC